MDKSTSNFGLKDFLSTSLTKCMDVVHARSGSIFLLDKQKNQLILEVSRNIRGVSLEGTIQKIGEGVAGKVALSRTPLLVKEDDKLYLSHQASRIHNYQTKSFLSVPLEYSGELIGVVNITDRDSGDSFDKEDLSTVLYVCRELGIAIYSLMRYLNQQNLAHQILQQEVINLKKSIEHSRKFSSLGKLAGSFVHELNNPLDGIIRYVNLALDHTDSDEVAREYLLEAKQGLSRVAKIVRSLFDFSWNLSKEVNFIDLNRTIEECLFIASDYLSLANIEVSKQFAAGLPLIPDYRLKLVFNNLIKNAYAAMKECGRGILSLTTSLKADLIEIVISDTGSGIAESIQANIFEPFFTTKEIGDGSGLGLAICYETIQRYNGTITVESKLNQGSTFIIRLPTRYGNDYSSK